MTHTSVSGSGYGGPAASGAEAGNGRSRRVLTVSRKRDWRAIATDRFAHITSGRETIAEPSNLTIEPSLIEPNEKTTHPPTFSGSGGPAASVAEARSGKRGLKLVRKKQRTAILVDGVVLSSSDPSCGASITESDASKQQRPPKSSLKQQLSSLSLSDSLSGSDVDARSVLKPKRRVRFSNVTIRVYGRTLGVHPFCSSFPSLALDWRYDPRHVIIPVEDREARRRSEVGSRRPEPLNAAQRLRLLMDVGGFTAEELARERERHEQNLWCGASAGWKGSWQKRKALMRRKVLNEERRKVWKQAAAAKERKERRRAKVAATLAVAAMNPRPIKEASLLPPTAPYAGNGNMIPTKMCRRKPKDKAERPFFTYDLFFRQERVRMIAGSTSGMAVAIKKGTKC